MKQQEATEVGDAKGVLVERELRGEGGGGGVAVGLSLEI